MAQIAVNPETGERVQFNEQTGQWVPIGPDPAAQAAPPAGMTAYPAMTPAAGALESVLQGVTLGGSDELQGLMAGAYDAATTDKPFSEAYDERRREVREGYRGWQEDNPYFDVAGNITGSLLPLAAGIPSQAVATPLRAATTGATAGGVAGALASEPAQRVVGAATGAGFGGLFGMLAPSVGRLMERVSGTTPEQRAARLVNERIAQDVTTPDEMAARLPGLGGDAMLADTAGENVMRLADAAASVPGKTANAAKQALYERSRKQANRVLAPLEQTFGSGTSYRAAGRNVREAMSSAARPLYDEAYATPIQMTDNLAALMKRPSMQGIWKDVQTLAREAGQELPDEMPPQPSMMGWDYIKRALDDRIEGFRDATSGRWRNPERGRAVQATKDALVEELDAQNPVYAQARRVWSGGMKEEKALQDGVKFLSEDASDMAEDVARMTDAERIFYRIGMARTLRTRINKMRDTNNVSRMFENEDIREKLQAAFPDQRSYEDFIAAVEAEARKERTRGVVTGNSRTMQRYAEQEAATESAIPGVLSEAIQGNVGRAAQEAVRSAGRQQAKTLDADTAEAIGNILFTTNPSQQHSAIRLLQAGPPSLRQQLGLLPVTMGIQGGLLAPGYQSGQ